MATAKKSATKSATTPRAEKAVASSVEPPSDIFDLIGKSQNIEEAAVAMQAMSHPLRIKVLCMLSSGEISVQEIVEAVGTTQGNVSQHLAILKASGMVASRSEGKKMLYRIEDPRIIKLISLTREMFCST
jgi:DNA-binding transcriptional ArsR family regulator